ncbi:arf-GAP with Rho-GAP domain, ANK repeat and PH domain-containing protein 1-like [Salarias fasciatus]|uniref:arf-GAP with Rho-GAP domain, ANK repeat and PH domain-containing protein 1-like n=1 Tax=Salarias fasciatus TaxID=181472 RepID=UPI00117662CF|nr:arf-GAP with Rho-GAP domain, ANK repeat and PH domain-containing protein 1-like [Salarias fasciatus]
MAPTPPRHLRPPPPVPKPRTVHLMNSQNSDPSQNRETNDEINDIGNNNLQPNGVQVKKTGRTIWYIPLSAYQSSYQQSLYPVCRGSVSPAIERCISHIREFGLKVEGIYRRCGIASKVNRIVEALETSPNTAPLEGDEQGVLDASSALKQYVRQQESLVSVEHRQQWINAAVISDEQERFKKYRWLLRQLPDDNRATLNALFGHFYMIHFFSEENKMSAHNLAVVLVPSLFQALNQDLIKLTKEFIIHSALLFLTPELDQKE